MIQKEVAYICAISGTKGSSGLGSVSREQMDSRTYSSTSLRMARHKTLKTREA